MKISVLIPAYKAAATIARTIDSVCTQTHRDWEIIVVEDGSNDGTETIVRRVAETSSQSVRYDNLGRNQGVSAARNRLLDLAQGDAIAFIDADDIWGIDHLALSATAFAEGADFVVSGVRTFDLESGRQLEEFPAPTSLASDPVMTLFLQSAIVTSSSVAIRRSLVERVGRFDLSLHVGEDRDFWLRCALAGARFAPLRAFTCFYAKHAGSTMARTLLVSEQSIKFYDKFRELPAVPAHLRRRQLASSLMSHGRLIRARDPARSVRCFWRAWQCTPLNFVIPCHLALSGCRALTTAGSS